MKTKLKSGKRNKVNVRTLTFVALLGAVSAVLMSINFAIPFAPAFLKFDISELPALFAGFLMGPAQGCAVVLVKILIKVLTQGTDTAFVGELMNIMGSIFFVLPASLIYRRLHTKRGAVIAMTVSSIFVSILFIFINMYIAFPMYSALYGMPLEAIVSMGTAANPLVGDLFTLMLFGVFPFNLVKHGITSLATYLVYKKCGNALRGILNTDVRRTEIPC